MSRSKLTLLECLAVIVAIGILTVLLMPRLGSRIHVRVTRCAYNLKGISSGLQAAQGRGVIVKAEDIQATLAAYNVEPRLYVCPDVAPEPAGSSSYGFNTFLHFTRADDSLRIVGLDHGVSIADVVSKNAAGEKLDVRWPKEIRPRHRGLCNVLTYDGAVQAIAPNTMDPLVCSTAKARWVPSQAQKYLTANCTWVGPPLAAVPACSAPPNR